MSTFLPAAPSTYTVGRQGNAIQFLVIHAMDGTLAATDQVFTSGSRGTSAHYGIEDGNVHQYIKLGDTAYHAGDWPMNLKSIGIEHSADPSRPASEATYNTSAQLIASLCQQFNIPVDRNHIKMHREVSDSPTACPVGVDIDYLVNKIKESQPMNAGDVINMMRQRGIEPTQNEIIKWTDPNQFPSFKAAMYDIVKQYPWGNVCKPAPITRQNVLDYVTNHLQ